MDFLPYFIGNLPCFLDSFGGEIKFSEVVNRGLLGGGGEGEGEKGISKSFCDRYRYLLKLNSFLNATL